jgi:hypothetical protein
MISAASLPPDESPPCYFRLKVPLVPDARAGLDIDLNIECVVNIPGSTWNIARGVRTTRTLRTPMETSGILICGVDLFTLGWTSRDAVCSWWVGCLKWTYSSAVPRTAGADLEHSKLARTRCGNACE